MPINYFDKSEYLPPMFSYAQNYEDVTLRRALTDIRCGFWVDIGAHHPTRHSVTRWFHENGWTGVNVEPVPDLFAKFESERPHDTNVRCVVGGAAGDVELFVFGESGLTTTSEKLVHQYLETDPELQTRQLSVPMVTLDELFEKHCDGRTIDFLKIDAEDAEADIIKQAKFSVFRPRIIVIENNGWQEYEPDLLSKDYFLVWYDGLNRWYVSREDKDRGELIARPPSIWDNFEKREEKSLELQREVASMRSSTSWRVTRPLRAIKAVIWPKLH